MASAKKLSNLVTRVVPRFVFEENPEFVNFVKRYFEYLEQPLGEYDVAANLESYRSIEETLDSFLDQFKFELAADLPETMAADLRYVISIISNFYKVKGTEAGFEFLYRAIFNEAVTFYYPRVDVLRTSDSTTLISEDAKITDSDYWQDFSYELSSAATKSTYFTEMIKQLAHPAGLKYFYKQI